MSDTGKSVCFIRDAEHAENTYLRNITIDIRIDHEQETPVEIPGPLSVSGTLDGKWFYAYPHPEIICLPDGRCYRTIDSAQLHETTVVHEGPGWIERVYPETEGDE